jgi:hypothetical protein
MKGELIASFLIILNNIYLIFGYWYLMQKSEEGQ